MDGKKSKNEKRWTAWKILFRHTEDYRPSIISLAVLGIISATANGAVPFIVGSFLDALIDISRKIHFGDIAIAAWLGLLLLWIFIQLAANIVDWIKDRKGRALRMEMQLGYQAKGFAHLLFLPLAFHKDEKIGGLSEHLSKTSWQISIIAENVLVNLTPPILSVIVGFIFTLLINPVFTLVLACGVAIYLVVLMRLVMPTGNLLEEGHSSWTNASADALQAIANIQSVKHMTAEEYEKGKIISSFSGRTTKIWNKLQFVWSGINFYQRIIVLATQAVIFFLSVYFIQRGELSIGQLVALNAYAGLLFGPFVMLGYNWQTLQNGLVSIRQAEEKIFSAEKENYHPKNGYAPSEIKGAVEFKNVSFSYDGKVSIFNNLNFKVEPGEHIAFVGKSGAGKSTAIDLISGYYFPEKGAVLVDGHNTREFDLIALRNGIAIVPQEPTLFNDTLMMNIRYGRLGASDSEVFEAAKKARAHEFIEELPEKYNQIVGERGVKLSVGQKQRIAIARAILRNPSILILDEPTSALDSETEKQIAESFEELMKGRTAFIIAHRFSTVRKADRILVFENGRIIEEGNHENLANLKNGIYKRLHDFQMKP
ncbi:MAG: ABC transporter ATP-binding protein [bacterium]|nr:ABC transporter ATP-binding protein [bacterium]